MIARCSFAGSCLLLAVLTGCTTSTEPPPIKVGVLHSLTGSVAISEKPINDTTLMAIDEINAAGGLLGRRLQPVVVDGRSDWPTFAAGAERLITKDKVTAIFGCYTSASRKSVLPVVERHKHLLLYPTYYEGMEQSPNIVYTGAAPNQFIIPAVKWFLENRGKKVFLVGSDYVFPRGSNAVIKDQLAYLGGKVLGEEYLPLGAVNTAPVIEKILRAKPEAIVSTVVGDTNIPFFRQLRKAGITPRQIPTLSLALSESELQSLDRKRMANDYVALNYFQSLDNPENKRFVQKFKKRYGRHSVVSDQMEAAYVSVHLWAQAVRMAESAAPAAVTRAIRGQRFQAPGGVVYVDEENLHTWKTARLGRIRADGQVDVIWQSEVLLNPIPYSVFRTRREWEDLLSGLYTGWGNSWAAPS